MNQSNAGVHAGDGEERGEQPVPSEREEAASDHNADRQGEGHRIEDDDELTAYLRYAVDDCVASPELAPTDPWVQALAEELADDADAERRGQHQLGLLLPVEVNLVLVGEAKNGLDRKSVV